MTVGETRSYGVEEVIVGRQKAKVIVGLITLMLMSTRILTGEMVEEKQ